MIALLDYLKENYPTNVPIFLSDIDYHGMGHDSLAREMRHLCNERTLLRFSPGIYYFPTKTILGPSCLSTDMVLKEKYISKGDDVFGFIGGEDFLNEIGLSYQIASYRTIVTNKEKKQGRLVHIVDTNVFLCRPHASITASNWKLVQLLGMVNGENEEFLLKKSKEITRHIEKEEFSLNWALELLSSFPKNTLAKLKESGLFSSFREGK